MSRNERHRADERSIYRFIRSYGLVCLMAVLGVVFSFLLYGLAMSSSIRSMEDDFQNDVSAQVLSLRHKTQVLQQIFADVQAFYRASSVVTDKEFGTFVEGALTNEAVVFIGWVPTDITSLTQDKIHLNSRRTEEDAEFRNMIIGSDSIRQLLDSAGASINASASIVPVSVGGEVERERVIIAVPTFGKPAEDEERGVLLGYMLMLLDVDVLFESVFSGDLYGSTAAYLVDKKGRADLMFYQLDDPSVLSYFSDNFREIDVDVEAVRAIPFAGETLAIIAKPAFKVSDVGPGPWLLLSIGLIITGFTVYWSYQQITRTIEIQRTVDEKTKALADSEMRVRLIIDHALDAIVTFDEANRILEWNKQADIVFGWTADEAIGKNVADIVIAPQYRHVHMRGMELFLKTGKSRILNHRIETHGIRRDGSIFPMESAVTELKLGGRYYFTAFVRDITERREAEQARERLAAIVLSSDDAIISKDLDGRITSWNKGAERLYGYTAKEAVGKNIRMMIPPDRLREEDEILGALAEGKTIDHFETVRIHKSGQLLDISATISPLKDADGRVIGASKVARDVTERKKVEERLKEYTANLKRSNSELDDFVYIVSHDLKEPIRGLYSYAQFLQEDYSDKLDEDGNNKLESLKKLAVRMEELIDTLLYYSRLGRSELAFKPTNMNLIVAKTLDLVEAYASEKNAAIVVQDKLPTIRCDRARVGEIFRNLIINGIKYNDSDDIYIEVGCTTDHKDCPGCNVFYVTDNGIGISEKHKDAVFKMFKRLHNRDVYGGGTGAGLAFVQKIIDRHGGKIWLESGKGEGTTFYFTLEEE